MTIDTKAFRNNFLLLAGFLCFSSGIARAQKISVPARITQAVDEGQLVPLRGNVHPLARPEFDRGAVADSQPMNRMLLLLQRSPEQEAALRQLMDEQQSEGSPNYHAWLTPEQFGKQFGPADADIQAVTDWLTKQGFQVAKVAAGRTVIEFSGNVAQVRNAFHTEIHHFNVNSEERIANVSDPQIPAALKPVVAGVVALHNFPKYAQVQRVGSFQRNLATGEVKPLFTYTDKNGTFYGVGPADFARIYNIPASADGSGQSIAIVGQSNINIQDIRDFRSMFGLPAYTPQMEQKMIVVNGPDPGLVSGDEGESDLDVEWAGAVAPGAQILFVTSQSTQSNPSQVSAGIDLSALYIIDNNLAPVMSESYGSCEASLGTTGNAFYNAMWQQAAAEGITVSVAAGDNGPAGCDPAAPPANQNAATQGIAVSGIASTPYNVAVGGTDFDQSSNLGNYWGSTNTATTQLSALGYIAEIPWDDSTCAAITPTPTTCSSVDPNGGDLSAGSGGPSKVYTKPTWQQGVITPNDNFRDLPDISLFASNGFNSSFYIVCESDANPNNARCDLSTSPTSGTHNFSGAGGTSGGTPSFAAIMALVNQKTGERQGNANYVLYALAAKENYSNCNSSLFTNPANPAPPTCVFYDITKGNNAAACVAGTTNCSDTGSGYGLVVSGVAADHGNPAFQAVAGYDLATGLGSINVTNLLNSWSSISRTATITTLSNASGTPITSGQSFSVRISVTPIAATGDVSLVATTSSGTSSAFGPFPLVGGTVTASTNLLPPGTVSIVGYYAGDATHAASTSALLALAVSGSNQPSKTTLSLVTFDANNNPMVSTGSLPITYGSPYILQIVVAKSDGTSCSFAMPNTKPAIPCPTGKVTLTQNGSPSPDFPNGQTNLNTNGIAEDQPIPLSATLSGATPAVYSLVAGYRGDANYAASPASNTLTLTVSKASATTLVASSPSSITSGASVALTVYEVTSSNAAGPTGNVQFTNGSTSLGTVACAPTSGSANTTPPISSISAGTAYCIAKLTTAISALYPPGLYQPRSPMPVLPLIVALLSLLLFALGWRWMPDNRRRAYAYAGLLAFVLLAVGVAGCGSSSGGGGGGRTVAINASYAGDTNYMPSSNSTTITVQ